MSKAISYSLFGYNQPQNKDSNEFPSYLRGLWINIRMNRILFPGWVNVVMVDIDTYNSKYNPLFEWLMDKDLADVQIVPPAPLCLAMLYRMMPVFEYKTGTEVWKYEHVLCRDTDSIATYREAQMVTQWVEEDKAICCITDSISHGIPMMGGMIGIRPKYFTDDNLTGFKNWSDMIVKAKGEFNWNTKGTDQHFLNRYCYPPCASNASEFFIKGMPYNLPEGNGRHYSVPNIEVPSVPKELEFTNSFAGHVGSAGYYETPTMKFINNGDPYRDEYKEIEEQFLHICHWRVK